MAVRVIATGVTIRLADEDESRAIERARRGFGFSLERSYRFATPDRPLAADEAYVVSQAFVDFTDEHGEQRWVAAEHHGEQISLVEDATLPLLRLAEETAADGLIDLLGDMGIAHLGVSRWQLLSAPRRIDLTPELETRLAPLRRR